MTTTQIPAADIKIGDTIVKTRTFHGAEVITQLTVRADDGIREIGGITFRSLRGDHAGNVIEATADMTWLVNINETVTVSA